MRESALHDPDGKPIQIHVGINTGEAMAGLIGPEQHQDYAVMGDTAVFSSARKRGEPPGRPFDITNCLL